MIEWLTKKKINFFLLDNIKQKIKVYKKPKAQAKRFDLSKIIKNAQNKIKRKG